MQQMGAFLPKTCLCQIPWSQCVPSSLQFQPHWTAQGCSKWKGQACRSHGIVNASPCCAQKRKISTATEEGDKKKEPEQQGGWLNPECSSACWFVPQVSACKASGDWVWCCPLPAPAATAPAVWQDWASLPAAPESTLPFVGQDECQWPPRPHPPPIAYL